MIALYGVWLANAPPPLAADDPPPRRVLLVGQGPDGHPQGTHEYVAGLRILAATLARDPALEVRSLTVEGDWPEGPAEVRSADAVVLFLAEGARWLDQRPALRAALEEMARRGGGLTALHWALGTREAKPIESFCELLGGCHGGPDRRYQVVEVPWQLAAPEHPILRGVEVATWRDEYYYRLKWTSIQPGPTPLVRVNLQGQPETVGWCWQRPQGGRAFGFTGMHFHANWQSVAHRRLITQGVLWTLDRPIPAAGVDVEVDSELLAVPAAEGSR